MRLWEKGVPVHEKILAFTAGEDPALDLELIPYDCRASQAHARMLGKIGILSPSEVEALCQTLGEIQELAERGEFEISPEDEDGHTAIENYLTSKLGEIGKKIHTARSRNDQVLTALRLYYRDQLSQIEQGIRRLQTVLETFSRRHRDIPLPGYTHTRKAMPFTVDQWASAFREAFADDLTMLRAVKELVDQSPAGSGAGFGIPLEIDREMLARELHFPRLQRNPLYVQNSRGKFEATLLHGLGFVQFDLNKLASDLIFFTLPELGYFTLPETLTTGSSIMPHKKNPDALELLRAYYHRLLGLEIQVQSLSANLISGYHRDLQLTKGPVMEAFRIVEASLEVTTLIFEGLKVQEEHCRQALTPEMYATHEVYQLVARGIPFREAYRRVAEKQRRSGR